MKAWGVAGCKGGWFFFGIDEERVTSGVVPTLEDLLERVPRDAIVLVDIPIGLPEARARGCDASARSVLAPFGSSVFPVPTRQAVYAETYEAALEANRKTVGVGLSKQSWGICPKIREVDALLQARPELRGQVREVHPEVCFWGLLGRPVGHSKKTRDGFRARLDVLEEVMPAAPGHVAEAFLEYGGFEAQRDDIVDALVAAVNAVHIESCKTLPSEPERDSTGLPMEMVYWPAGAS
jgi:predicted RNase H-like nuclease